MYARLMELTVKPKAKPELTRAIDVHILPMLKGYRGFFDVINGCRGRTQQVLRDVSVE